MLRYILPLGVFGLLVVVFAVGLQRDPRAVPSPLIGKPVPEFSLPQLHATDMRFGNDQLTGQVSLVNVWASWCVACREEHPVLLQLARQIPLYGMDYKDRRDDALAWLQAHGDPYRVSAFDEDGRVGIDWGVYGVPETFVIDAHGIIQYKHIGPLTPQVVEQKILPLVRRLNGAPS